MTRHGIANYVLVQSWLCAPLALSTGSKLTMCSVGTIYWFKADYVLRWHYLLVQSWLCAPKTLSTGSKLTMCSDGTIYCFKVDYVLRWHYLLVQSWLCAPKELSTISHLNDGLEEWLYFMELLLYMTTSVQKNKLCIMFKIRTRHSLHTTLLSNYMWGSDIYSHVENTRSTTLFHSEGRCLPIKLV
jgi:hypothetical protein